MISDDGVDYGGVLISDDCVDYGGVYVITDDGVDGAIGGESAPQLPPRTPGRTVTTQRSMTSGLSTSSTALGTHGINDTTF